MSFTPNAAFQVRSYDDVLESLNKSCTELAAEFPDQYACVDGPDSYPNLCIEIVNNQQQFATFRDAILMEPYDLTSVGYIGGQPSHRPH